jgi:hypothetical protein
MKYDSLKNKKQKIKKEFLKSNNNKNIENKYYKGFEKGVDDSFDLFASVIDSYKKYMNNVKLLMKEQKNVWLEWVKYYDNQSDITSVNYLERYNKWLFNYAFNDINGKDSDSIFNF